MSSSLVSMLWIPLKFVYWSVSHSPRSSTHARFGACGQRDEFVFALYWPIPWREKALCGMSQGWFSARLHWARSTLQYVSVIMLCLRSIRKLSQVFSFLSKWIQMYSIAFRVFTTLLLKWTTVGEAHIELVFRMYLLLSKWCRLKPGTLVYITVLHCLHLSLS